MNIFESITAIQAAVEFIGKDKKVENGNYKYRGVDQVLNTLHPLFAKYKVFAVPDVLECMTRETRETAKGSKVLYQVLKVKYHFYAEDGTSVTATVVGEAMDSGDKVSNKCMSVAYKYACFQILSIPTEETTQDPDDVNQTLIGRETAEEKRERVKREIEALGANAVEAISYLEKEYGKKIEEFDNEDLSESYSFIKRTQERRKQGKGND